MLEERVGSINNTIEISRTKRDTYINVLVCVLDRKTLQECQTFINGKREARCLCVMEYQNAKFNRLWHKNTSGFSNIMAVSVRYMYTNYDGCSHFNTSSTSSTVTSPTTIATTSFN